MDGEEKGRDAGNTHLVCVEVNMGLEKKETAKLNITI